MPKKQLAVSKDEERVGLLTVDDNVDTTTTSTLFDSGDEIVESGLSNLSQVKIRNIPRRSNRRKRYHLQRGIIKLGRFMLCAVIICLMLLLLLYLPIYNDVQNRHVGLPDWTLNTSRDVKDYVSSFEHTALIEPRGFCQTKAFLIIAVCSGLNNFVQRQTIRETWGNTTEFNYASFSKLHSHLKDDYLMPMPSRIKLYSKYLSGHNDTLRASVRIVFLVGRNKYEELLGNETLNRLHNESEKYNDIIQENFIDSYNNLTLKSILALKHISKHCSNTSAFFLKCDDDTFVNVPNLLHYLLGGTIPLYNDTLDYFDPSTVLVLTTENRLKATKGVMRGHQFCSVRPISDVSSKWYMPSYMYPREAYPKYLSGAGYLMSIDVVQQLYDAALNTSLVYLEDVYITGLCAERAHVERKHHPLFSYTHSRHMCAFKGVITQHDVKDDSMMEAWQFVSNYTIKCPPPGHYLKQLRLRKRMKC